MNDAVIITNDLPLQVIALSQELATQRDELALAADSTLICSAESLISAEALFKKIDQFSKQVNEDRMGITRKIDDLKKKIMAAEASACQPLLERRTKLAAAIAGFRRKLEEEQRERQRIAREEAEKKAQELQRQQEEARRIALEKYQADKKAAEEKQKAEAELFGEAAEKIVVPEPVLPTISAVSVAEISVAPTEILPRSTVRTTTRRKLVIDNAQLIIAEACKTEGKLFGRLVLSLDEKAIGELIKAGCKINGAHEEQVQTFGANG